VLLNVNGQAGLNVMTQYLLVMLRAILLSVQQKCCVVTRCSALVTVTVPQELTASRSAGIGGGGGKQSR
jgi:hypothetical protein